MRVGAAHAERADPGASNAVPFPRAVLAAYDEGPLVQMQFGVGAGVVQSRRNRPVLEAENRLDQTRHPGRRLQVTDVGLDRTDVARAGPGLRRDIECLSQAFDLDRVAERRAGAMRLDVAHGRGVDLRDRLRLGDDVGLTCRVGRGVGHLRRSVVVERRSPDHRVNTVPVVDGGLQRLEDHDTDSAAEDGAVGPHVERAAVAGRRHHRTRLRASTRRGAGFEATRRRPEPCRIRRSKCSGRPGEPRPATTSRPSEPTARDPAG